VLEALAQPVPPEVRLRRALKCLLRSFGLRSVEMVEEIPAEGRQSVQDGAGDANGKGDEG
jgi:hypothetical protein